MQKCDQNQIRIATVGEQTDRQTDRLTDSSVFIICPLLCYSSGTDIEFTQLCLEYAEVLSVPLQTSSWISEDGSGKDGGEVAPLFVVCG